MTEANGTHKRGEKQSPISNGAVASSTTSNTKTDYTRWRLKDDRGCQTWHYLETDEENKAWPQTLADKWHLGMDLVSLLLRAQLDDKERG
jgi:lanosterol synthase